MKIHIVREGQETIENYKKVTVSNNSVDLSDISDNECTFILAGDTLDNFSLENIPLFIQNLTKKVRMGGSLVIGGTDIRLFAKSVINGMTPENEASNMVGLVQSMSIIANTLDIIKSLGMQIESTQINGFHYEVTAKRGQ